MKIYAKALAKELPHHHDLKFRNVYLKLPSD